MRTRMTWNTSGVRQRRASEHPAYPDEGPASPAYQPEPGADAYDIGGPSEFAEDPHPGPYTNTEHPATPDEGPASPAYKAAALERKAAKCIRIATAMLGDGASVAAVEDQALALMDLDDRAIKASLSRLAGEDEEEMEEDEESKKKASLTDRIAHLEGLLNKKAESEDPGDDDDDDDDDDEDEESKKKASLTDRIARIERVLIRLAGEDEDEDEDEEMAKKAGGMWSGEEAMLDAMFAEEGMFDKHSDDDAMLDTMLAEEGMSHMGDDEMMDDDDAMLDTMLAEEGMSHMGDDEMMDDHEMMVEDHEAMLDDGEMVDDGEMMNDPMGVMEVESDEMMVLANLFSDKAAADEKEEKAEEKAAETVQEEVEHAAEKKAALRPQPKKASTGAARLGGVSKEAGSSEVNDLSKLWESAPDVSKFF